MSDPDKRVWAGDLVQTPDGVLGIVTEDASPQREPGTDVSIRPIQPDRKGKWAWWDYRELTVIERGPGAKYRIQQFQPNR